MSNLHYHIKELLFRSLYPLIFLILGFILVSQYFIEIIIILIKHSGISIGLISTPYEAISTYIIGIAYVAGMGIALPIGMIQIYLFLRPAIYFKSKFSLSLFDFSFFLFSFLLPFLCLIFGLAILPFVIKILISPYSKLEITQILY
jgi:hypothetical protein